MGCVPFNSGSQMSRSIRAPEHFLTVLTWVLPQRMGFGGSGQASAAGLRWGASFVKYWPQAEGPEHGRMGAELWVWPSCLLSLEGSQEAAV